MNYHALCEKRDQLSRIRRQLPKEALESFEKSFEIEYTHNSTAIEGNTLSLVQTKAVLEDGISVGGKTLREIYEVVNHNRTFQFIKKCIGEGRELNENIVKDIHSLLMENILSGGIYRNVEVRITGAKHKPPVPNEMFGQIKNFYADMQHRDRENAIEFAAWTHAEFVKIHPFVDGNGRTSRMIMNYQLMSAGFLPVSIAKESMLEYFEALESYAADGDLKPFAEMIAFLEEQRLDEYLGIAQQDI